MSISYSETYHVHTDGLSDLGLSGDQHDLLRAALSEQTEAAQSLAEEISDAVTAEIRRWGVDTDTGEWLGEHWHPDAIVRDVLDRWAPLDTVTAWADAFGTWHVRVPADCASPIMAARRRLRDKMTKRISNVAREVWAHPERVAEMDGPGSMVFREGDPAA